MYASEQFHGRDSRAFSRDLISMVWFLEPCGNWRQLAIRDLRAAPARRGSLDPDSAPWKSRNQIAVGQARDARQYLVPARVTKAGDEGVHTGFLFESRLWVVLIDGGSAAAAEGVAVGSRN